MLTTATALTTALRATVKELERLRYDYGHRNDGECPSCRRITHTVDCRLVAALDLARAALEESDHA